MYNIIIIKMMIAEINLIVKKEVLDMKENQGVRNAARSAGVPLWKVAAAISISEPTLIRWLRFPLPEDKERRIMAAIAGLAREAV